MGVESSVFGMKLFKLSSFSILFLLMVCTNAMVVSGTGMGLYSSTEVPRMADVNSPSVTGAKLDNRHANINMLFGIGAYRESRSPTPEQATTQKPRRGGGLKCVHHGFVMFHDMLLTGDQSLILPCPSAAKGRFTNPWLDQSPNRGSNSFRSLMQ